MKSRLLFLFLLVSSYVFSQSVNDYAAVLVPLNYDFLKSDNQYRLNTLTKFNLQKAGFVAYYTNEMIPEELNVNNRCNLLNVDVLKESAFLVTKLYVVLKDCYGKVVYKSEVGKSKEKEFDVAYVEALNKAFEYVYALHYKYNGKTASVIQNAVPASLAAVPTSSTSVTAPAVVATAAATVAVNVPNNNAEPDATTLFAQPIKNGFQLIDSTPKVIMKVYKTTNPSVYQAIKGGVQGVMTLKDNQWFFEYYQNDTLMSEKINVKF
ncbi:hypothetical protein [Flavobacterium gilvum]|uniref:Secreted protein n=1 Tax=Flavobacterium gilvum TaxID=1492737 RepID=A0AAC9N4Q0_9FLAO|nr:hypothetical protein [Flavobacterium gilvum]AOW08217.1 hypothetical protein EM308_01085 [Flavobacterium gilvum]KFC59288.1 hypothetical protein FEM08_18920 [Flavobacterium gilvum]